MTAFTRHFTFGSDHMCNHPNLKGRLADHWVSVRLPFGHPRSHREVFIEQFTTKYCPDPYQFSFEYPDAVLEQVYFPLGQLVLIHEASWFPWSSELEQV
jgi:hypothetical protein